MQNLYIIVNPTGTMQCLDIPDSLYDVLEYADFEMTPVNSHDIRVRNLPSASNTVEMPWEQFENLQEFIPLYQHMQEKIQYYAQISSHGLVNFLIRDVLSANFSQQMPKNLQLFPRMVALYQHKIVPIQTQCKTVIEQRKALVLLRPKFVISLLEAYFEQNFIIANAQLSQEKFANASFFDGSAEFKIALIIDNVLIAVENGYQFSPITLMVAGKYFPTDGYQFDQRNWQIQPDINKHFDNALFNNKAVYLSKIIQQSRTTNPLEDFTACLVNVAERFRQDEVKRLAGLPKPSNRLKE